MFGWLRIENGLPILVLPACDAMNSKSLVQACFFMPKTRVLFISFSSIRFNLGWLSIGYMLGLAAGLCGSSVFGV